MQYNICDAEVRCIKTLSVIKYMELIDLSSAAKVTRVENRYKVCQYYI